MKKTIFTFLLGFALSALFAFAASEYIPRKSTGEVDQVQGLYIYLKCKPVMEYDVIGSEKTTFAVKGKPEELLNIALKKARKDFPNAEAIIFSNDDMDKYDFIKFKE